MMVLPPMECALWGFLPVISVYLASSNVSFTFVALHGYNKQSIATNKPPYFSVCN